MSGPSRREDFTDAAIRHWGTGDVEGLFPEGAQRSVVPWKQAGQSKSHQGYDADLVQKAIREPVTELHDVDPRGLKATQPFITRPGVEHYMRPDYEAGGETYADKGNLGNQFPVVYRRPMMADPQQSEDVLLSGHHRATSALLRGQALRARLVEGPWGTERKKQ